MHRVCVGSALSSLSGLVSITMACALLADRVCRVLALDRIFSRYIMWIGDVRREGGVRHKGHWSCPPTLRRLEVLAHRDEFLNLSKYLVIYEQECVWSGPGGWSGVADVGEGCGRCQMSVCEECSARVCARYGLRGVLVGGASNPGPQRSSSRTPTRGGVAEAMEYQQFFADAQRSLGLRIDHLFVPRGVLSDNRAPAWVGANDDVEAMKGAFRTDGTEWVYGSQSTAYRTLLRERSVRQCVVSDIVRSDTGILAEESHALAAPIGALSSDLFCRSMQSLVVVDRVGVGKTMSRNQVAHSFLHFGAVSQAHALRMISRYRVWTL